MKVRLQLGEPFTIMLRKQFHLTIYREKMEHVRFGIIGLGNMGSAHAAYMNAVPGAVLAALCDIDEQKLKKLSDQHDVPAFTSAEKMIDSGTVDAVLIATPHYAHPPIAKHAFARGIHVLCEKPVAVSVGEARALNEAFEKVRGKVKFALMFNQRTDPKYRKMQDLIASGELGQILRVTWIVTDWLRTWTYYASGGWRATWAGEGGGVLLNQCPHNLDLLQWITGLMPSRITAVATIAKRHPIEVEDDVSAILEYPNGAIGHFVTTTGEGPGTNRLEIACDKGLLIAEGSKLLFKRLRGPGVLEILEKSPQSFPTVEVWPIEIPVNPVMPHQHQTITENFVAAVLRDEPLIAPGTEGVRGLEIGNAMLMSGLTRTPVDLPMNAPAFESFLKELIKTYGGKKTLATPTKAEVVNMAASMSRA
jgi:predicted dehydrogenase